MLKQIIHFFKTEIKFKNLFKISNIFLLALIYITAIPCIIFNNFEFSEKFWQKLINNQFGENRIFLLGVNARIGEVMMYHHTISSLQKQQIDYVAIQCPEYYINFWFTKHFYQLSADIINYFFQSKFNLSLTHYVQLLPTGYNIVYLNVPNDLLFNDEGKFKERYEHLIDYDAYLDLYSLTNASNPILEEALKCHKCYDTKKREIIPGYIGHNYVQYQPAQYERALITGSIWGCNRGSLRMISMLKKLESDDLIIVYGISKYFKFLKTAYKGSLENFAYNSNARTNLLKLYQENGIALVTHNLEHMLEGIPTNRIIEATMGGAVVITDRNRFITKFFGDSVLYFDAFGSEVEMYNQIKSHIEWIKNNPEAAERKAKAAYDIAVTNFTIEEQINKLLEQIKP